MNHIELTALFKAAIIMEASGDIEGVCYALQLIMFTNHEFLIRPEQRPAWFALARRLNEVVFKHQYDLPIKVGADRARLVAAQK